LVCQLNGVRDLVRLDKLSVLLLLENLTVMGMKSFCELLELFTALESRAEFKELDSNVIVNVKSSCVVAQSVEDDLADIGVEIQLREKAVLLFE